MPLRISSSGMPLIQLVIRGRVQGVGFRRFVRKWAEDLKLCGWVRNRPDGSVEVEAEGEPHAIADFVMALRQGPAGSRVEQMSERHDEGPSRYQGFTISG